METVDYSYVVGVFRDADSAQQATNALQQAGIEATQIQLTEQNVSEAVGSTLHEDGRRFIVQVQAAGKEQEAVDIMAHHGANNADLPPGTVLTHGKLIGRASEQERSLSQQPASVDPQALPGPFETKDKEHFPE